jgi:hypothetical protein
LKLWALRAFAVKLSIRLGLFICRMKGEGGEELYSIFFTFRGSTMSVPGGICKKDSKVTFLRFLSVTWFIFTAAVAAAASE